MTELMRQDPTELVARLEEASGTFEQGLVRRLEALRDAGNDWLGFQAALEAKGLSPILLILLILGCALATYGLFLAFRTALRGRTDEAYGWKRAARVVASAALAVLVVLVVTRFAVEDLDLRRVLRIWSFAVVLFCMTRVALLALLSAKGDMASPGLSHARRFRDTVNLAILWALVGISVGATLRVYQVGSGLRDFIGTLLVIVPVMTLLVYAYWQHRAAVSDLIAPPDTESGARRRIARGWPWLAIAVLVMTALVLEVGVTLGRPLPPLAVLMTLILVLVAPHIDAVVAKWSERAVATPDVPIIALAMRRTTRFLIAVAIFCLLVFIWGVPVMTSVGIEASAIARSIAETGLIALAAAFIWNAVGALASRVAQSEGLSASSGETEEPRTRLGTLLPLLSGVVRIAVLAIALLSILVAAGINVWPIIGGLSIFGIAIGFGSQTLVKDVVSGLFFLIDDAFRVGEYIETAGAKGTVEKISVRSVSLRNPRGALASVPYGQIGKVVNFSRGWVIEKLVFRVAFDTDVDLVRKLFKTIGQEIAADPELNQDLLEPFKSQGISAVEDGTLIVRGKFKARAGKQFAIRKAVLTAVQKAFRENNIHAVPKPLGSMTGLGAGQP